MSSSEGLPYVQHNNKNNLEASGSHSNVNSNKDENESSSNSNTKIENASILDTVPFHVELHQHAQSGRSPQHGLRPREDVHSRHQSQLRPLTRYQHRSLQYRRAPRLHHPKNYKNILVEVSTGWLCAQLEADPIKMGRERSDPSPTGEGVGLERREKWRTLLWVQRTSICYGYSCKECGEGWYLHHKSCAELPLGLHHPSHPNHPLILFGIYTYHDNNREEFDKFSKCDVCGEKSGEYSYCCYRCNFNINIRCSSLSLTIQTEVHDHQLTRSIWKLMKFTCDFCGKEGNLPYCCVQCDFAIHSRCAACPRRLKVYRHNHPLHLTPSLEVHPSDSPICLLCVRKVDTLCLYYCSRCDFAAHLYCAMLHHNREYINLQELKEEQSTESKSEDPGLHQSFDS
ncbi:uncharacterized protein LOC115981452 [Quercus lobata]|uniref:uncharacterized protein LOC115981452 n=1 Tax=Quercus lobata TaxID=97700 RepID=UPI0012455990|nr:uncharacterized protein LOC115981452 [Quercus lobata]